MVKEELDPEKLEAEKWLANYLRVSVRTIQLMSDEELTIALVGDLD